MDHGLGGCGFDKNCLEFSTSTTCSCYCLLIGCKSVLSPCASLVETTSFLNLLYHSFCTIICFSRCSYICFPVKTFVELDVKRNALVPVLHFGFDKVFGSGIANVPLTYPVELVVKAAPAVLPVRSYIS